jgi:hypothetical protein
LQGSYAGSDEGADEVTKPGLKPGTVLMTQQRKALLDLLRGKPGGMLRREVMRATGEPDTSVVCRLSRAKAAGLIVTVGRGSQTIWGMAEHLPSMRARLVQLKAAAYKRERKRENAYAAVRRALQPKRRLPNGVRVAIPAVNSVWALAA